MPSDELLDTAILWLQNNEGDGPEGEACHAVAEWLEHEKNERFLRLTARQLGITVAALRREMDRRAALTAGKRGGNS